MGRLPLPSLALGVTLSALFCGCGGEHPPAGGHEPLDPEVDPITEGDWYRPGVETRWQWQLQVAEALCPAAPSTTSCAR